MAETSKDKMAKRRGPVIREDYDGVKYKKLAPGITTHPLIRSGRPCIEGTGLKVTDIVVQQTYWHMEPAQIAEHYDIKLSQVNDALNYYEAHTDYIDTDIKLDNLNHDQLAEAQYGVRADSLLSRRKPVS